MTEEVHPHCSGRPKRSQRQVKASKAVARKPADPGVGHGQLLTGGLPTGTGFLGESNYVGVVSIATTLELLLWGQASGFRRSSQLAIDQKASWMVQDAG